MCFLVAIFSTCLLTFSMADTGNLEKVVFKRKPDARYCSQKANVTIFEHWPVAFKAMISVIAPEDVQQWKIHLSFTKTITLLQVPKATYSRINKTRFILTRASWDSKTLKQGDKLEIEFIAYVRGQLPRCTALFVWKGTCISTSKPPTEEPFTPAITTEYLTTLNPSTQAPLTDQPSTNVPSTQQPPTHVPSTQQPSTNVPSTQQPLTNVPSTQQPSTHVPSTQQPSTHVPSTNQPLTNLPSTQQPSTDVPSTQQPSTYVPSTQQPSANVPSTQQPSTNVPSTQQPSTHVPSTQQPSTKVPSTQQPSTYVPSTQQPSIHVSSTQQPSTHVPSIQQPSTHIPSTYIPSTVHQTTHIPHHVSTTPKNVFLKYCNKAAPSKNEKAGLRKINVSVVDDWPEGFKSTMKIKILEDIVDGWEIHIFFSGQIKSLTVWRALTPSVRKGTKFVLKNMPWNKVLQKDTMLEVSFLAFKIKTKTVPDMCAVFVWKRLTTLPSSVATPHSSTSTVITNQITTQTPTTSFSTKPTPGISTQKTTNQPSSKYPYNYDEVLHKSILFYEAQRSGVLPTSNRISWRGNSAVKDRGENGEDLVGGWYDAGDHVKFGFPMAFSTTLLTWGLLEYRQAYQDSGELQYMLDGIKWPLDYFIKAHVKPNVFYGQVGNGYIDHNYWGRPETMTMKRPAFKVSKHSPGSDLAAETAAAMAAGSLVFRSTNPLYSQTLLKHAKELYDFAENNQGLYSNSIQNAAGFYNSHSYKDELTWGALWLYKATSDNKYLQKAERYVVKFNLLQPGWGFSWDEKTGGVQLLLYQLTKKDIYKKAIKATLNLWLPGNGITYTPKGLAWRLRWGPNRYAANTAFLALSAAESGLNTGEYRKFAKKQIHYMLGDSGRSFVVGFGKNSPMNPHHRGSSCSSTATSCSINDPSPNPNILYGALVGGPDEHDNYNDDRSNYVMNEVATDYNAGFQSAVAALKSLQMRNQ